MGGGHYPGGGAHDAPLGDLEPDLDIEGECWERHAMWKARQDNMTQNTCIIYGLY